MTTGIDEQTRILTATAGGYLRNVIRESGVTCTTCATPVDGYDTCYPCGHAPAGRADLVVPLTYAVAGGQAALAMRQYKDGGANLRQRQSHVVQRLLFIGISKHEPCIERVVGEPVHCRLTIPSSRSRAGVHPFAAIARGMNAIGDSPVLVPGTRPVGDREVSRNRFDISPANARFDGQHVLLLDDTWTAGSRTQSAALLLRQLGAVRVSVMVVARWIEPGYKNNRSFIRERLAGDFDVNACPVTGTTCP